MPIVHQNRLERVDMICSVLRGPGTHVSLCHDVNRLMNALEHLYAGVNAKARQRAMQRDLRELVASGRIEVVNPGGRPLRYRRCLPSSNDDTVAIDYQLEKARGWVAQAISDGDFSGLWRRLVHHDELPLLTERQVYLQPHCLVLRPARVLPTVLYALVCALARNVPVTLDYQPPNAEQQLLTLHPLCLIQRCSRLHVKGLIDTDETPVTLPIDLVDSATPLFEETSRVSCSASSSSCVESCTTHAAADSMVELCIHVRGALCELLQVCPLGDDQTMRRLPAGSEFDAEVHASVLDTDGLLRWLLAGGDALEVIAPTRLRNRLRVQAMNMLGAYLRDV